MQTLSLIAHESSFMMSKILAKSEWDSPQWGTKCRWDRLQEALLLHRDHVMCLSVEILQVTNRKWYAAYLEAVAMTLGLYTSRSFVDGSLSSNRMFRGCKISSDKHVMLSLCNSHHHISVMAKARVVTFCMQVDYNKCYQRDDITTKRDVVIAIWPIVII